jgi:hypothetical protein
MPQKPRPRNPPNPDLTGANPAVTRPDGKRGAPYGNQRALKHGHTTAAAKEARWAYWRDLMEACAGKNRT